MKVRWGVLGAAKIARTKVIPAMQRSAGAEVVALASRSLATARATAAELGIPKAYGSYEEMLADPEVEAVYNPLPNHLHVPWSIRAAEAGKHVLCEKPIALDAEEARRLLAARDRTGVLVQEAFMVRTHPQWLSVREEVRSGRLGELRALQMAFSYFNRDPANVRNQRGIGGGALMDIGCYPVVLSRFLFEEEPTRVVASIELDPEFGTDRLTSALLEFPRGQSVFTCATQLVPYQRMQVLGTRGRIEVEVPVNAPPDRPCRIFVDDGRDAFGGGLEVRAFEVCDQYTLQADQFSRAIREGAPAPVPLEDAVANMEVIDALVRSSRTGAWERPGSRPGRPGPAA
ncbi:MAG TPA: Gfo/Idh/MocA family oxidoreductase [Vicinamibacteria bacterium]|nr:Gfo/Idh/MocA family oxidoreductase [Vicinamibacteria bacterium]